MTFAIGITLAALLAASLWLRDQAPADAPTPVVRSDPSSQLAELRDAAAGWLSEQSAELDRVLTLPPRFESQLTPRPLVPEVDSELAAPAPLPEPHSSGDSALLAQSERVAAESPANPPLPVRDLDRSAETVRRLLALYVRLEARL